MKEKHKFGCTNLSSAEVSSALWGVCDWNSRVKLPNFTQTDCLCWFRRHFPNSRVRMTSRPNTSSQFPAGWGTHSQLLKKRLLCEVRLTVLFSILLLLGFSLIEGHAPDAHPIRAHFSLCWFLLLQAFRVTPPQQRPAGALNTYKLLLVLPLQTKHKYIKTFFCCFLAKQDELDLCKHRRESGSLFSPQHSVVVLITSSMK